MVELNHLNYEVLKLFAYKHSKVDHHKTAKNLYFRKKSVGNN